MNKFSVEGGQPGGQLPGISGKPAKSQCPFIAQPVMTQTGQAGFMFMDFCGFCMFKNTISSECEFMLLIRRMKTLEADIETLKQKGAKT